MLSVIGTATSNKHIKSVVTKRSIDVFVSRLDPDTQEADLQSCVTSILPEISIDDITSTKLPCKVVGIYASFHLCVRVDALSMKSCIDKLMSAESWPDGLIIRRYFHPKNKHGE